MEPRCTDPPDISVRYSFGLTIVAASKADEPAVEPIVAEASSEGKDAIGGFKKPEGWTVDLVAAEPDVANIVAFDIDARGRFWVCETFRQDIGVTDNRAHDERWLRADLAANSVADRIAFHKELLGEAAKTYAQQDDRIRMLEDTDGDGKVDRSVVFASGFNGIEEGTGAGVLARGKDVFYTCIPRLWKLTDNDGDGKSDGRVAYADGFGVRVAFRGHDMHGLIRGPDGRLYFSIGDRGYNVQTREGNRLFDPASGAVFRCEMDGSNLEVYATGLRNPQELAFDEFGNLFSCDNNSDSGDKARWVYIVEGGDTGWRMSYQYFGDRGPFNREKLWYPFHQKQAAYIVPPVTNISDGPSGLTYYPGTGLGDEWQGRFVLADFRGSPSASGIRTFRMKRKGAFYKLVDSEQPIWSVLATDVAFGPDGALYVSDWVDGWVGVGKGRIYRFADPSKSKSSEIREVQTLLNGDWTGMPTEKLSALLGHKDQRVRLEAQWELASRGEAETFREILQNPRFSTVNRLHAVWGLGQILRSNGLPDPIVDAIEPLLRDGDPYLRAAGAELVSSIPGKPASDDLRDCLSDRDARVRFYASLALARLGDTESFEETVRLLDDNDNEDPIIRHGGMMALAAIASSEQLAELKDHRSRAVRRVATVALRRHQSKLVAEYLDDDQPLVVLEAARAINDAPINDAMPALARLIEDPTDDDALMRRVLNANFRLGRPANLHAVAQYATRSDASESLRLEALEVLSEWKSPDERDRVMNLWRPIDGRPDADVAGAVERRLSGLLAAPKAVADRAIELAAALGVKKVAPQLIARVNDTKLETSSRASSVVALARLDPVAARTLTSTLVEDESPELRIASIQVLAEINAPNLLSVLTTAIASDVPQERQMGWDLIRSSELEGASRLIDQGIRSYIDGSLPKDVWLNVWEASENASDAAKRDLARAVTAWKETEPLAEYRWASGGGDAEAGSKLFYEKTELSCVRCHRVHRQGGQVGPVLTTIGKQRDRQYLLEAIVAPDKVIAKGYETTVIVDAFGQVQNGIVKEENDDYVQLVKADGTEIKVLQDDIDARRRGNSAMPADLIKHLSPRELRDLVAYLEGLKIDPRANKDEIE